MRNIKIIKVYDRCDDRPTPPDGRRVRAVHWNPWSPPKGFADRSRSPPTAIVFRYSSARQSPKQAAAGRYPRKGAQ